ncbi:MAG: dTMP kinase [Rhodospirillaceae bacterium]
MIGQTKQGFFITLEGGEGSGKSTQIKRLDTRLRLAGHAVKVTREPGGSPGAEAIRELLINGDIDRWDGMAEALLNFAARCDHVRHTIRPALNDGKVVISDRFADSTMAYQGYGHGLGRDVIERLYATTLGDFKPDLTLILNLPAEEGLLRANSRGGNRFEDMDIAFHQRLHDGFLEIANEDKIRCRLIDATGTEETVEASVWSIVGQALKDAGLEQNV